MNSLRVIYMREKITQHFQINQNSLQPFKQLRILDVGCGAGIFSESAARLGAEVIGIDASEETLNVAKNHAKQDPLIESNILYEQSTPEIFLQKQLPQFDVVVSFEVIEHVNEISKFLNSCIKLLKPGGLLFLSTINKTMKSYIYAIVAAEYILEYCPIGTHDWYKFIEPIHLTSFLLPDISVKQIVGITYHPFSQSWKLSSDISVNYLLFALKK